MPRLDDADALVEAVSDAETMRYIGDGSTTDAGGARRTIEKWLARWEASGIGQFVVERRADGRFVGRAGFLVWDPIEWEPAPSGEIEIGWTIVRSQWGNGYATEAALALRDWADRPRLISLIQHGNERSVRVAEKLGERYERDVVVRGVPTRLFATAPR
jgi:RimJ/RimL family protein N-acetyltransferase